MTVTASPIRRFQVAYTRPILHDWFINYHRDNSTSPQIILFYLSPRDVGGTLGPPCPLCYLFNEPPQVGHHFLHCSHFDVCSKYSMNHLKLDLTFSTVHTSMSVTNIQ